VRAMLGAGLVPHVEGSGRTVRQAPAAGTIVPKGSDVRLSFEQSS
jgi:cell division protein FtsI (penicillin-binding protein 3)